MNTDPRSFVHSEDFARGTLLFTLAFCQAHKHFLESGALLPELQDAESPAHERCQDLAGDLLRTWNFGRNLVPDNPDRIDFGHLRQFPAELLDPALDTYYYRVVRRRAGIVQFAGLQNPAARDEHRAVTDFR